MNLYLYDNYRKEIKATLPLKENMSYDQVNEIIYFLKKNNMLDSYLNPIIAEGYNKVDLGKGRHMITFY